MQQGQGQSQGQGRGKGMGQGKGILFCEFQIITHFFGF